MSHPLRSLPSVNAVLETDPLPQLQFKHGNGVVTDAVRAELDIVEVAHGLDVRAPGGRIHLRSSVPGSYVLNGLSFRLDEPQFFILSWGTPTALDSASAVRRRPGRCCQR